MDVSDESGKNEESYKIGAVDSIPRDLSKRSHEKCRRKS